jgi:uncharacterized protein YecE (DUF72 family)
LDPRVGLCGFTIGAAAYIREFPVVEVQQTFYEPPQDVTMRRWRALAPTRFEFTIKAWQLVTHDARSPTYRRLRRTLTPEESRGCGSFRDSEIVHEAWRRTLECAQLLSATAVLLQCPRSFKPTEVNLARLRSFAARVPREGLRLLWEPRGEWPTSLLTDLCSELDLVHVVDPFVTTTVTTEQTYFRLHGTTGSRHVYSDDELAELVGLLPSETTAPPYVMFNNLPRVGDARRFAALLAARRPR